MFALFVDVVFAGIAWKSMPKISTFILTGLGYLINAPY
jgi:hypothetical protein